MNSVNDVHWPLALLDYVQGATADSLPAYGLENGVAPKRVDLLCCQPTNTIPSFKELTQIVASVAMQNPRYQLYFRGQRKTYSMGPLGAHSLCPTLWRGLADEGMTELRLRSARLFDCDNRLLETCRKKLAEIEGKGASTVLLRKIENNPLLRWALLQHYEVCKTPMLDITRSLRVACSFALESGQKEGYVYVMGMPYQREMVTADHEDCITCVSLLGAMPPSALRPYVQDGYLACDGDWWRLYALDNDERLRGYRVNFADRVIAVLCVGGPDFWDKTAGGGCLDRESLYPPSDDFAGLADIIVGGS